MKKIRTADLYYGAYLMCNGAKLTDTCMGGSRGDKVFFVFTGKDMARLAFEYISGEATVNLNYLKSSLKHLKDIVFELMNQKTLVR